MREAKLICSSSGDHTWQLYAGFAMLAQKQELGVSITRAPTYAPGAAGSHLRVIVDGRRIVYDTDDSEECPDSHLQWADYYFKRSFNTNVHSSYQNKPRLYPLGLNYGVCAPHDWWARRSRWSLRGLRTDNYRAVAGQVIRLLPVLSRASRAGRDSCTYRHFEQSPTQAGNTVVLFARTWDPAKKSGVQREQRIAMNSLRTESIRQLRAALGPRFLGGLMPTEFAIRHYPDLTLDEAQTSKKAFLSHVRNAAVCITSIGLVNTNGWRLAEFIAASRPILTEPLLHRIPGAFSEGINFMSYTSPEELVEKVTTLLSDEDARHTMRHANHKYYRDHVRPDALIRQSLETVFPD